mgnify:CR=1 FL=1
MQIIFKLELFKTNFGKGRSSTLYIFSGLHADGAQKDTSQFRTTLKYGYALSDILDKTSPFKGKQKWLKWADKSLVVRERISEESDDNGHLYFYPSPTLFKNEGLKITSDLETAHSFAYSQVMEIDRRLEFFTGIRMRRNPIYQIIENSQTKKHSLSYLLPQRLELKKQPNGHAQEYAIASSPDSSENRQKYDFNIFSEAENLHHIQASISYEPNNTGKKTDFQITDYQAIENSDFQFSSPKHTQPFTLKTKN